MKHNMNVSYKSFLFYYIPLALNRLSGAVKIKGLLWKLSDYDGGGGAPVFRIRIQGSSGSESRGLKKIKNVK